MILLESLLALYSLVALALRAQCANGNARERLTPCVLGWYGPSVVDGF